MKKLVFFLCTGLSVMLLSTSAMAFSIGGYFDLGVGQTAWDGNHFYKITTDVIPTGGFILDTSLMKNDLLHYRFKAGFGAQYADSTQLWKTGIVNILTIAPSALRTENFQFWFGPRIGLYYVGGTYYVDTPFYNYYNVWYYYPYWSYNPYILVTEYHYTIWVDMFRADFGLVFAGLNFNLGPASTLSFELAVNYGINVGYTRHGDILADSWEISATIAYLHRMGDY